MASPCLFCGTPRKLTQEHTLYGPIRDLFPSSDLEILLVNMAPGNETKSTTFATAEGVSFKRKAYCDSCNSGWMQEMDNEVLPFLKEMIRGNRISLSPSQQMLLAKWATKIGLVYESLRGKAKAVDDNQYGWFYAERRPFPALPIQLAASLGRNTIFLPDVYCSGMTNEATLDGSRRSS